jgi:hypothetical protein
MVLLTRKLVLLIIVSSVLAGCATKSNQQDNKVIIRENKDGEVYKVERTIYRF